MNEVSLSRFMIPWKIYLNTVRDIPPGGAWQSCKNVRCCGAGWIVKKYNEAIYGIDLSFPANETCCLNGFQLQGETKVTKLHDKTAHRTRTKLVAPASKGFDNATCIRQKVSLAFLGPVSINRFSSSDKESPFRFCTILIAPCLHYHLRHRIFNRLK